MSTQLTSEHVDEIFRACLFKDGEDTGNFVATEGITMLVGFHPGRLASHKAEIEVMLGELADDFMKSKGGGASFLRACFDKYGHQWTGLHQVMEKLFLLGIAINKVELLASKEMWSVLPGGMPYYAVN